MIDQIEAPTASRHLHHPDVHGPASAWSEGEVLHVAAAYSNPFRWETRRRLANDFRRHMESLPNVRLYFGGLAYGDRPFEVTDRALRPADVQLRTSHELFHKENILNAVIRTFPPGWKYGAIVDADFHFTRHDIALETIHQLQHYAFVQMFSTYTNLSGRDLGRGHQPTSGVNYGFAHNYIANGYASANEYAPGGLWDPKKAPSDQYGLFEARLGVRKSKFGTGAPGGAWAFRRTAFDEVGGLMDRCILGAADHFMAFGLIGETVDLQVGHRSDGYTADYKSYIQAWQKKASRLGANIGYVDGHALHHFHGPMAKRGYATRDSILVANAYSPRHDVTPDWTGILQLSPEKPRLRDQIRAYFLSRNEDHPHVAESQ